MAITITRPEQRDAIYENVILDISSIGDIEIAIDNHDYEAASQIRRSVRGGSGLPFQA